MDGKRKMSRDAYYQPSGPEENTGVFNADMTAAMQQTTVLIHALLGFPFPLVLSVVYPLLPWLCYITVTLCIMQPYR